MSSNRARAKIPATDISTLYFLEASTWINFFQRKIQLHATDLHKFSVLVKWASELSSGQTAKHVAMKTTFLEHAHNFMGKGVDLTLHNLKIIIKNKGIARPLTQSEPIRRLSAPAPIATQPSSRLKYYSALGVFNSPEKSEPSVSSPSKTLSKSY